MKKNVYSFTMVWHRSTCYGDLWSGIGFVGGTCYYVDSVFLGYNKRQIARLLKNKILMRAAA